MIAISIVIPTYRREDVLVDSIRGLLALAEPAAEIIVVDQTPQHEPATEEFLRDRERAGQLRVVRLAQPSITAAMNAGLMNSSQAIVLFLDDDIRPGASLVAAHRHAHESHPGALVAGRVLQPWDREDTQDAVDAPFVFSSTHERRIDEFMGGNFSLAREAALAIGGFDENFVRVAYRFEAEFAHRWRASGKRIVFAPQALIHHLKAGAGGTRTFGDHLTTWRADHAVGAYYWALRTRTWREFARRPLRSVITRFHLRRPWRIPATLAAELGGMLWAIKLHAAGPRRLPGPPANGT